MGMMKKNQTKRFSYFDQKIKQKGENFMGTMNPYDISRDSRMIFKDIAYANIDYSQHIGYFTDMNLIYTLETTAYENYLYHYHTYNGLCMEYNNIMSNPALYASKTESEMNKLMTITNFHKDAAYAYSQITDSMFMIESAINQGAPEMQKQIIDILMVLCQRMSAPQFKQIFANNCPYIVLNNN